VTIASRFDVWTSVPLRFVRAGRLISAAAMIDAIRRRRDAAALRKR
jgi:hypothetical protein